jgi:MinD-like ATPase involved in chromosome partitioning or flagellar assembly
MAQADDDDDEAEDDAEFELGDLPVEVEADGLTVRVLNSPVAVAGSVVDTVLDSLAAFARVTEGPVNSLVVDHRPGGFRQRIRVFPDGRSIQLRGDDPDPRDGLRAAGAGPAAAPSGPPAAKALAPLEPPRPLEPPKPPEPPEIPKPPEPLEPNTPKPVDARPAGFAPDRPALPTVDDFLGIPPTVPSDAEPHFPFHPPPRRVLRGLFRRTSGGTDERTRQRARYRVQRLLDGPRTIAVVNPKGGAHKTTSAMMLASAIGAARGGSTLAWDNNETHGTMGWRGLRTGHRRTAIDMLRDIEELSAAAPLEADRLRDYVRSQGAAMFDILASDESPDSWSVIDGEAFRRLHSLLQQHYQIMVVDTGNNMRAPNWGAAIEAADTVAIVSTMREDTAASAAWMIDAMRQSGHRVKVANAVTILSEAGQKSDTGLAERLSAHFEQHTRSVVRIPYDQALVHGDQVRYDRLAQPTRDAWLEAAATVADTL